MKFGFVIPLFNTVDYFEKCLLTLINQTYKNFEIIIVDNYSNDGSYELAKKYAKKYNNIKIFRTKIVGVGAIRNLGIKKLNCDYFITIDSDDYINENLLEVLNEHVLKNSSFDMIRFNAVKVDSNRVILDDKMFKTCYNGIYSGINFLNIMCNEFIDENKIFGPSWLYAIKLKYYKKHKFKFSKLLQEDFGIMSFLLLKSKSILSIDFLGYYYVQRNNSITNKKDNKYLKAIHLLSHYDNYINKIINNKGYNKTFKNKFKQYLDLTLIKKYNSLNEIDKKAYYKELKKRGVFEKKL